MSNVMMRIVGCKVSGAASLDGILNPDNLAQGALQASGELFNVDTVEWEASKKGTGLSSLSPITVTRKVDGASSKLLSFFFSPGETGEKVEIAFTQLASSGVGLVKYYEIKLANVRISSYSIDAENEAQPTETFELSYSEITQSVAKDEANKMVSSGEVTFNLASASLTSAIKDNFV